MGLPAPIICAYLSREQSKQNYDSDTSFQIGKIEMVTNSGTYIDYPFHRFANGRPRPVHTVLSGAGILIVEHLCNLNKLPAENLTFTAAPPKFKGVGTFPVISGQSGGTKISQKKPIYRSDLFLRKIKIKQQFRFMLIN